MTIEVSCPSCRRTLRAKDSAAGVQTSCPDCGESITIPDAPLEAIEDDYNSSENTYADDDRRPCSACGELIVATAAKCRFCGEFFDETLKRSAARSGAAATSVEERAEQLLQEKQDKTTALQIFLTGLLGCFAPIIFIYGVVFLLKRPYAFPRKGLAIAGTILHGLYTLAFIANIIIQTNAR